MKKLSSQQYKNLSEKEILAEISKADNDIEECVKTFDYQGGMGAINRLQNLRLAMLEKKVDMLSEKK